MNDFNLDNETLGKLNNMLGKDNVSDALSNISPEMIENFSQMMKNNSQSEQNTNNINNSKTNNSDMNFDMETIMKMKTVFEKLNSKKNDPRSNLLNSLKPYLRESRQGKVDEYMNLLKLTNLTDLLNNKKENDSNE